MSENYPEGPYDAGDAGFHLMPGAAGVAAAAFYAPVRSVAGHHKGLVGGIYSAHEFGDFEQQTSGLAAGARVSGQSISALRQEVRGLASDLPIGVAGARQYVGIITQLGVTSAGSEPKVGQLARTMAELNAATGSVPQVALGFGQLNRQLASLDPHRLRAFADSLTTLVAKGGGSADGIVAMSRSIAPFAAQAGLGETAVLGISSAFTKLGDEGTSAATAVGRVLTDISRSVKTGSADLNGYAAAVGMTARQFRALYSANPAAALERVVTALGQGGGRGAEFLATRGLDGVRSQRALLQLSQSGNLAGQIALSAQGYNSGATAQGAHAAFNTLDGSLTKVKTTAGEATAALGGPFAHALTFVANLLNTILKPVEHLLNSKPGQIALDIGMGTAALGILGGKGVLGGLTKLGPLALGRQAVSSGPVASTIAGLRGNVPFAPGSWMGRAYNPTMAAAAAGQPLGVGVMGRPNQFLYNMGTGLGQGLGLNFTGAARQQTLMSMLARRGVTLASGATAGYLNLLRAPFHLGYQDPTSRQFNFTGPAARSFGTEFGTAFRARDMAAAYKATTSFIDGVGGAGAAARRVAGAFLLAGKDVAEFSLRTGYGAARGIARSPLMQGIGSALTGPMGLMAAGYGAYSLYQANKHANAQFNDQGDIYAELNKLNDGLGAAGQAAVTFADQANAAAAALGAVPTPTTTKAARHITAQQIAAAGDVDSSKSHTTFRGTDAQIAAQISQISAGGLSPAQLSKQATALYKQGFSKDRVNDILAQVSTGPTPLTASSIASALGPAAAANRGYSPSFKEDLRTSTGAGSHGLTGGRSEPGAHGTPIQMSKTAKALVDRLISDMAQQYGRDVTSGGQLWALQNEMRTANLIQAQADATGQADLIAYTAKSLSAKLTGKAIATTPSAVLRAHGNIVQLSADDGHKFSGEKLSELHDKGLRLSGPGGAKMVVQPFADAPAILSTHRGGLAAVALTNQQGPAGQALSYLQGHPEDTEALTKAQKLTLEGMRAAGGSWQQIANSSGRVAANVSDQDTTTYKLARAMQAYAQTQQADADRYKAPGASIVHQFGQFRSMTQERGPNAAEDIKAGQQGARDLRSSIADTYRQRLMAQYQFQIQSTRSTEDYNRSTQRAEEDYQRQSLYAEQDYQRSRFRAVRDFNIQIQREIQDAGANMYDPYTRIQSVPVWDAVNLAGNEREQVSALRRQVTGIKKLKQYGLTEQAIRQLGLFDPSKLQEVDQLVADLAQGQNQGQIGQLNKLAEQRQALGGQLLSQSPDFKRSKDDFKRQLSDAHADYTRQTGRMGAEFHTAMSRAAEDQQRALTRMAEDLHNADLQITGDFESLQRKMIQALNGQQVNWGNTLVDGMHSTIRAVKKLAPEWQTTFDLLAPPASGAGSVTGAAAGAGGAPGAARLDPSGSISTGQGDNPTANRATGRSMAATLGWTGPQWNALNTLWSNESGWSSTAQNDASGAYGIPQGIPSIHKDYAAVMHNGPAAQIQWGLRYIQTHVNPLTNRPYGTPQAALDFWNNGSQVWNKQNHHEDYGHWYGTGAIFTSPQRIGVGDHGHPEAVIPLDGRGMKFVSEALRDAGVEQIPEIGGGGGRPYAIVIDHSTHNYDQRVDFRGSQVKVEAADPTEMARQLEARARAANLTAARGVTWRSS